MRRRNLRLRRRVTARTNLLAAGFSAYEAAPSTLAATFLTSIACLVSIGYVQQDVQPTHQSRPAAIVR